MKFAAVQAKGGTYFCTMHKMGTRAGDRSQCDECGMDEVTRHMYTSNGAKVTGKDTYITEKERRHYGGGARGDQQYHDRVLICRACWQPYEDMAKLDGLVHG